MDQYVRDCRITQVYEGTNGVRALDLVGRKLPADNGRLLRRFFQPIASFIEERERETSGSRRSPEPLTKACDHLQRATAQIARGGGADPEEVGAGIRLPATLRSDRARLYVGAHC